MSEDIAIKVNEVSKTFRLPHEKQASIKGSLINFRKGKKGFEKQKALNDVSFEVKKGEFFGIVGRNGSGKSTLLKMLAGIYSPSKGSVQVNGKLTPFIELGVGFNPELTGRENVFLNGALLGFNRKEMNLMYEDIVEFAELERFMDQKLKNYSSGMQVRLAFSIAIRAQGDILLLDEVLAVGDAAFQQKCYNYFEELKEQKKTVVFVSHDMGAVRRFCTTAIHIKNGELISEGATSEIADQYIAENINRDPKKPQVAGKASSDNRIDAEITEQSDTSMILTTSFSSSEKGDVYVGIAVIKDGVSVAEVVTSPTMNLNQKGRVSYSLDTSIFNGGVYNIDAALFRLSNRELLAVSDHKVQFSIKGNDIRRGGAIKLEDTWYRVTTKGGS